MKKILSVILRTGISIALLVFLFSKIDFKATCNTVFRSDPFYFFCAFTAFVLTYMLLFYRWFMLLKVQAAGLSLTRVLISFLGGIFFSLFLPSTIGGDIARSIDLGAYTKRHSVIIASVLLDRLSGFVGLLLVAIFSLVLGAGFIDEAVVYILVLFMVFILIAVFVILFNNKIYRRISRSAHKEGSLKDNLRKLHSQMYFFKSKPRALFINLLYSVVCQIGSAVSSYYMLLAMGVNVSIVYLLVINPIIILISMLPVSIGGLGLRDASSVYFLAKIGVAKNVAFAFSLLNFAFMAVLGILGGIVYVSTLHYRRLQPDKSAAVSSQ